MKFHAKQKKNQNQAQTFFSDIIVRWVKPRITGGFC